ncbi:MAG: ATP-binding cassette domain-containing protein [Rhodobacteraceae bacterium]|nr:ATP-binding cassette domain-containing protein [Paracoccaceae bacterium]
MLELQEVSVEHGSFKLRADVRIAPGNVTAFVGESGAGKSTLFGALSGFENLASGQILWSGTDIAPLPPAQRPVSILFQDNNLFPHLTVERNVALGLTTRARPGHETLDRVHEALEQVGLAGFGARKPGALSGGQRSRVSLARALVRSRPIVLLDEPFAALGPALKAEMLDLTATTLARPDTVVLMITHDPQDALRIADQTMIVSDGLVQMPRDTADLFASPPPDLQKYFGK